MLLPRVALGVALVVAASSLAACASSPDVNGDEIAPEATARSAKKSTATKATADDDDDNAADTGSAHDDTTYVPVTTPIPASSGSASDLPPADPITVTPPPAAATPPSAQTLTPPNAINVKWSKKSATAEYSLDLITKSGTLIGPCINSNTVKKNLSQTYAGVCTDQNQAIAIADVGQVRVCWTEGGDWSKASCAAAIYDGSSTTVTIAN